MVRLEYLFAGHFCLDDGGWRGGVSDGWRGGEVSSGW